MGRPLGSKDSKKRKLKSRPAKTNKVPVKIDTNKVVETANDIFISNLSGNMKKLYKQYTEKKTLPIDDLKDLANTMKARYKIALQTEMHEHDSEVKQAKKEYDALKERGVARGRNPTVDRLAKQLADIAKRVVKKYTISSTVTTLGESYRSLLVEIERIENGKDSRNVNIFQILNGTIKGKEVEQLEDFLFPTTMDEDIRDAEDVEFQEDAKEPE